MVDLDKIQELELDLDNNPFQIDPTDGFPEISKLFADSSPEVIPSLFRLQRRIFP